MNTALLRLVRKHFASEFVSAAVNRHNQRAWVRSVRHLGERWVARPRDREMLNA